MIFSGTDIQAVGLTDFNASGGKFSRSFQLAASLAQTGKRVLLLDADLRNSMLQSKLGVPGKVEGLNLSLSGIADTRNGCSEPAYHVCGHLATQFCGTAGQYPV